MTGAGLSGQEEARRRVDAAIEHGSFAKLSDVIFDATDTDDRGRYISGFDCDDLAAVLLPLISGVAASDDGTPIGPETTS